MTTQNTLTKELCETIKHDMIYGYKDKEGTKKYPKLTEAAKWYNISYDALKQKAKDWKWRQKREDYKNKLARKLAEKRESEKLSESEAEEIIVNDSKFNNVANKLRRAANKELDRIINGEVNQSIGYHLMNIGRSLESAQKVSKVAAGEPSEISKVDGIDNKSVDNSFTRVDKILNFINQGNDNDGDPEV
jgi:hypothetical protein